MPSSLAHPGTIKRALPRWSSTDKGLADALNLLAEEIEKKVMPDIRLPSACGTMELEGNTVWLRPNMTSAPAAITGQLQVVRGRPAIFAEPEDAIPEGSIRLWVTWGLWNGKLPADAGDFWCDVPEDSDFWIVAKATTVEAQRAKRFLVDSWEIDWNTDDSAVTDDWGANSELPEHVVIPLGFYSGATTKQIVNAGSGSLWVTDYLSGIDTSSEGVTLFNRNLKVTRQAFTP